MTSDQIRQQFLDFFASKGHTIVDSSPVVPHDDPTLMFANAGMNQFKDVFLGTGSRPYKRVADTQKCIRAGGKHNDLDDVGQDTYHHTFFEMLGNWSFGDYFKKEAIEWAWELLTEVWGIEKERLHATYFEGEPSESLEPDSEAAELWRTVTDIDPTHVHPGNKKDNFWEMGDTGPCGPCSEIHVDLTPDKTGGSLVNAGDPRVIELWNLVFIQYNRGADRKLTPLPNKHVDTGLGFERLCAVLVGMERGRLAQTTNYDTDVFTPIFAAIQRRTAAPAYTGTLPGGPGAGEQIMIDVSYRVIADHLRCLTFALTDGAVPSNVGRGYVLRRILRRAVRYGRQYFDIHEPFLCDLVEPLVGHMGKVFPELRTAHGGKNVEQIKELFRDEEASFIKTLNRALAHFDRAAAEAIGKQVATERGTVFSGLTATFYEAEEPEPDVAPGKSSWLLGFGDTASSISHDRIRPITRDVVKEKCTGVPLISGRDAFRLYDTYGFPVDLTQLMAEELGLTVDIAGYEQLMEQAQAQARAVGRGADDSFETLTPEQKKQVMPSKPFDDSPKYEDSLECEAFMATGASHYSFPLQVGHTGHFGFDRTCFYAEQGGQVSDTGFFETETGRMEITALERAGNHVIHAGLVIEGEIHFPQRGKLRVNPARRSTMKNHTATHMLNWALREVLGDHVQQKGSLVDPEKTRFDFSHNKPLTAEELTRVESLVNDMIDRDLPVYTKEVDQKKAREITTLRAVFGEKYPDTVRVVSIGAEIGEQGANNPNTLLGSPANPQWMKYPVEFCGGTHLKRSSEAERFVLTTEEAVAKGIRRVVGISGEAARKAKTTGDKLLAEARALVEGDCGAGRGDQPAPTVEPIGAKLAAFQQRVTESTIPIPVRHELREIVAELQKLAIRQEREAASDAGGAVMERVSSLLGDAETIAGATVLVGEVPAAPVDALRGAIDWVRNKTEASAVLLAMSSGDKVTLVAGMSRAVVAKGLKAGELIKEVAPLVGGRGGGRPDMAQGGGDNPSAINAALDRGRTWLRDRLS